MGNCSLIQLSFWFDILGSWSVHVGHQDQFKEKSHSHDGEGPASSREKDTGTTNERARRPAGKSIHVQSE